MALNPKQRAFVKEYLKDRNASRAYRAAGYSDKGAGQSGARLLKNAQIQLAVDKGIAKLEAKLDISIERITARIAEIAFHTRTARASDVMKACELLGRHQKMFTDVMEVTGKDGGPQVVLHLPSNRSEVAASAPPSPVDGSGEN